MKKYLHRWEKALMQDSTHNDLPNVTLLCANCSRKSSVFPLLLAASHCGTINSRGTLEKSQLHAGIGIRQYRHWVLWNWNTQQHSQQENLLSSLSATSMGFIQGIST